MDTMKSENTVSLIGPYSLVLDITNQCNFRCLHCFNDSGTNAVMVSELTDTEILEFVKTLLPFQLRSFCFCGGEPLLRFDLILEVLRLLSVTKTSCALVSNGFLFDEEKAAYLRNAGLNRIQFSLDGANAQSHEKLRAQEGSYDKAMDSIKIASAFGFDVAVAFCPTVFNMSEFHQVCDQLIAIHYQSSSKLPINLRVQPLMLMGRAKENLQDILPDELQYRRLIRSISNRTGQTEALTVEWGDPVSHIISFSTLPVFNHDMHIRANGDLVISPYLPLVVGNIRQHTLQEYWDAGFSRVWEKAIPRRLARDLHSISDMQLLDMKYGKVFHDDLYVDLIDGDLDNVGLLLK